MNREELEYHLETDTVNYGTRYKANPDYRWKTPEFAALAADAVRKLQVLQSTKAFWTKTGNTRRHGKTRQDRTKILESTPGDRCPF